MGIGNRLGPGGTTKGRIIAILGALAAVFLWAGAAHAGETILRGPTPSWVVQAPEPAGGIQRDDASPIGIELLNTQYRFGEERWHSYFQSRIVARSPQALSALGSVALAWNPSYQDVTVHSVVIVRGDERIDALAGREFEVLRRETNLEAAMIDGALTGVLALQDLRVGDAVEFSYSVTTHVPVLDGHAEFVVSAAVATSVDMAFVRGSWPTSMRMQVRATEDWATPELTVRGDTVEFEVAASGIQPPMFPSPPRCVFTMCAKSKGQISLPGERSPHFSHRCMRTPRGFLRGLPCTPNSIASERRTPIPGHGFLPRFVLSRTRFDTSRRAWAMVD